MNETTTRSLSLSLSVQFSLKRYFQYNNLDNKDAS